MTLMTHRDDDVVDAARRRRRPGGERDETHHRYQQQPAGTRGEPTKTTVGATIRSLDARVRRLEYEARRDAEARDRTRAAVEALSTSVETLGNALHDCVREVREDHAAWGREREALRLGVEEAARRADALAERASERAKDAERARRETTAIDGRVSEALKYVREVRDEFLRSERVIKEAKDAVKELETRDARRERAMDELESRAKRADETLRDELETVREETSRAESAIAKMEEIGGLAEDLRELAKWSKRTAEYQNRRLASLERANADSTTTTEGTRRELDLVATIQSTALAMRQQQARLATLEERGEARAKREAAIVADVSVVKRALGEHHGVLARVCDAFDTELALDIKTTAPTSSAFMKTSVGESIDISDITRCSTSSVL
jgi:DNA repair exonuclease SbcCD ATPase subunit